MSDVISKTEIIVVNPEKDFALIIRDEEVGDTH